MRHSRSRTFYWFLLALLAMSACEPAPEGNSVGCEGGRRVEALEVTLVGDNLMEWEFGHPDEELIGMIDGSIPVKKEFLRTRGYRGEAFTNNGTWHEIIGVNKIEKVEPVDQATKSLTEGGVNVWSDNYLLCQGEDGELYMKDPSRIKERK